jgi:hypothetical protein
MTLRRRLARPFEQALARRIKPLIAEATADSFAEVEANMEGGIAGTQEAVRLLHQDLGRIHVELQEVLGRVRQIEPQARRAAEIARHIFDEEVENRRRLHALRRSEEYELAFTEEEPLVSFLVPTYRSYETLRDLALPSILGQSYRNVEVIVVGDSSPPETAKAIEEIGDPRVRFYNRPVRGPYPTDPAKRWYVIGSAPYDDALALARGRWIAGLGDDDEIRPEHTSLLLAAAREQRLEHVYGRQVVHFPDGEELGVGDFPPDIGDWGLQAAIFHAGLRFFELELTDVIYEEPNDWSLCRRMLRAGVRFGMIDEVIVDKHEMRRATKAEWSDGSVPRVE